MHWHPPPSAANHCQPIANPLIFPDAAQVCPSTLSHSSTNQDLDATPPRRHAVTIPTAKTPYPTTRFRCHAPCRSALSPSQPRASRRQLRSDKPNALHPILTSLTDRPTRWSRAPRSNGTSWLAPKTWPESANALVPFQSILASREGRASAPHPGPLHIPLPPSPTNACSMPHALHKNSIRKHVRHAKWARLFQPGFSRPRGSPSLPIMHRNPPWSQCLPEWRK